LYVFALPYYLISEKVKSYTVHDTFLKSMEHIPKVSQESKGPDKVKYCQMWSFEYMIQHTPTLYHSTLSTVFTQMNLNS